LRHGEYLIKVPFKSSFLFFWSCSHKNWMGRRFEEEEVRTTDHFIIIHEIYDNIIHEME
jgi:hypothetical protein